MRRQPASRAGRRRSPRWLGRWLLGGLFIYLGVSKVLHGAEFLSFVREQLGVTNPGLAGVDRAHGAVAGGALRAVGADGIAREAAAVLARWWLGMVFIYMGLNKALPHPEAFLKLVRQYEMVSNPCC